MARLESSDRSAPAAQAVKTRFVPGGVVVLRRVVPTRLIALVLKGRTAMAKRIIIVVVRALTILVGVVFIIAALSKAIIPPGYLTVFGQLERTHPWLAGSIIDIEVIIGTWLLIDWHRGTAAILALLLLAIFSGVIIRDMYQHYPQPCGCFGAAWQQAHEPAVIERGLVISLVRNALLAMGAGLFY
jgi:uncharacterized membrane protein YraQ (UPF0718 family)